MKRLFPTAAILLATSTPAFTQNTEQENNAAVAAVIYMIAQKRCNMTTGDDGKLRGMTISVIEGNGFTWEQVVYGKKQMLGQFLKTIRSIRRLPTMILLPSKPSAMARAMLAK